MDNYPDPRHLIPAITVGFFATAARFVLAGKPRPWRVVIADGVATCALSVSVYYLLISAPPGIIGPISPEFAGGASSVIAILGWGVIERVLGRFFP